MKKIVIAIDGPAGAGKSTISKIIAEKLSIEYIDTGAMYRAFTLKLLLNNVSFENKKLIKEILDKTDINFINGRIFLDGIDVSEKIREPYVSDNVSAVATKLDIRLKLVEMQRRMAGFKNVVMDGRDIGTNVLTDANYKFYLTATVIERANRRYKELMEKGNTVSFDSIYKNIENRDNIDSNREVNPLKRAEDAVLIDTTCKSIENVVDEILSYIK